MSKVLATFGSSVSNRLTLWGGDNENVIISIHRQEELRSNSYSHGNHCLSLDRDSAILLVKEIIDQLSMEVTQEKVKTVTTIK